MRFHPSHTLIIPLCVFALASCTVGPDYVRPTVSAPAGFKEVKGWKLAKPRDHVLPSSWWEIFQDKNLDGLVAQVAKANQSVIQAEAQYRQAQHLVQSAQSSFFPLLNMTGTFNRFKAATGQSVAVAGVRNLFGSAVSVAWEPDLWGSVRRQVEANTGNAQASAANLQALILSSQAALAANYVQLRILDEQKKLFDDSLEIYKKTLEITKNRYAVGVAAKSEVVQVQAQLESVQAQAINLGVQRASLEHAIAVLIGESPAELSLNPGPLALKAPAIPVSLPSELLERRPDIAAAERKVSAANAQIGVAKAAYYPTLNLASSNGFQSTNIDSLFTMARRYWALGPAGAALTLFDGGAKNAQYKQAIDTYDATVAAYRQTVLTGFQEVEDNLSALRILEQEKLVQDKAVASANEALALMVNQYRAGTVSYLNVMTAQQAALANQQTAVQLLGQQLAASVLLVKALGGGWQDKLLPDADKAAGETKWTDYLILPVE